MQKKQLIGSLRYGMLLALALGSRLALGGDLWIADAGKSDRSAGMAASPEKHLRILQGSFPATAKTPAAAAGEVASSVFVVDPDDQVTQGRVERGEILFRAPLKGHHWVYLQQQRLQGDALEVNLSKYRFYNRQGDVQEALLKEIRGRTNDSKYGRPPLPAIPFEIVLQKPQQDHHISCCLYSGDRVRLKLYQAQQPITAGAVRIDSDSGWSARLVPDETGLISFEIPRYRYSESESRRGNKQLLLITADYEVETQGEFQGAPYRRIHYRMSLPIDFRPSPLEWAAKLPAFLLLGGVLLITGFGVFLYRVKVRRRRLACD